MRQCTWTCLGRRGIPVDAGTQANDGSGHLEVLLVPHFDLPVLARADHERPDACERGGAHRAGPTQRAKAHARACLSGRPAWRSCPVSVAYPLWAGTATACLPARRMSHRRNVPSRAADSSSGCDRWATTLLTRCSWPVGRAASRGGWHTCVSLVRKAAWAMGGTHLGRAGSAGPCLRQRPRALLNGPTRTSRCGGRPAATLPRSPRLCHPPAP